MFKMAAEDAGGSAQSQLHQHVFSPLPGADGAAGEGDQRAAATSSGHGGDTLSDTHLELRASAESAATTCSSGAHSSGATSAGLPLLPSEQPSRLGRGECARAVLQSAPPPAAAAATSGGAAEATVHPQSHVHGYHYTPSSLFRAASQGVLELMKGGAPPQQQAETAADAVTSTAVAPDAEHPPWPRAPAASDTGRRAHALLSASAHRHSRHSMSLPDLSTLMRSAAAAGGSTGVDDAYGTGVGVGAIGAPFTEEDEGRLAAPTPHAADILDHLPKLG